MESRSGQSEKSGCDGAQPEYPSTVPESGARMALHSCPELGQDGRAIIECGLPRGGSMILVETAFCM